MALIASLSLLLIGLVGVGLAPPAAAAVGVPPTCPAVQIVGPTDGITTTTTWTLNGVSCVGTVVMTRPANVVPGALECPAGYEWNGSKCGNASGPDVDRIQEEPSYNCIFGYEEWAGPAGSPPICTKDGVSPEQPATCAAGTHLVGELCFPDPTHTVTLTCEAGLTVDLSGYPNGSEVTIDADAGRLVDREEFSNSYHYGPKPLGSQNYVEVTVFWYDEFEDDHEDIGWDDGVDCSKATADLTCTAGWTASLTDYLDYDEVRVTVDGEVVLEGQVTEDGAWSGNGPTNFATGEHTMQLQAGYDGETREWRVRATDSVSCTPPPPACITDCGGTTTVTTEVPPVVVAPALVDVPAAVAVPAAATVAALAPATVTVPQAATLPSAVPAGGGSSAPGTPLWALVMVIAGALGAISMGIRMAGSRTE